MQQIGDILFNYELLGDISNLSPIVMIAGYTGDINLCRSLAERLSEKRQVLIFDPEGSGSTQGVGEATLENMAENIHALYSELRINKPILIGFALGASVVQQIAYAFPNDVSQIILICSVMQFSNDAKQYCEQLALAREQQDYAAYAQLLYRTGFGNAFKAGVSEAMFVKDLVKALPDVQTIEGQQHQLAVLKTANTSLYANKISIPAVVIAGTEDQYAEKEVTHTLAQALQTQPIYIEGGHGIMLENAEAVLEAIETNLLA